MRFLFGSRTWLSLAYLALGLPFGVVTFSVVVTGLALGVGLLPLLWSGLVVLVATVYVAGWFATVERRRAALMLEAELPARPRPAPDGSGWIRRTWRRVTSRGAAMDVLYSLLMLPVGTVLATVVVAVWSVAVAGIALPAYGFALPGDEVTTWVHWPPGLEVGVGFVIGVLALLAAPWVTRHLARAELDLARWLLSPSRAELLSVRVSTLQESRARVVDAADAERRRIERDLHDGAQQHLVSLAMNLGMAKEKLDSDPEAARELVTRAHAEAKASITELRNVVRGVYPAVLTDRGLDAALSALAARSPVPVRLDVALDRRPGATTEAIAYFVVSEALTNVARHSAAERATVRVTRIGSRLQVSVSDDGRGGALEGAGSGLAGLRDRVAAVDGTFVLTSPPGGGTTLTVEVPCAS